MPEKTREELLEEIVRLKLRIAELEAAGGHRAQEDTLRAANQQLRATEQQLRAANQQLRAANQQLRATNQQLRATEEKLRRSEVALIAERNSLLALLTAVPVAVFIVDEDEYVIRVNPETERLFASPQFDARAGKRCGDLAVCVHRRDDERGCGFGPSCLACLVNGAIKKGLAGEVVLSREAWLEVQSNGVSKKRHFLLGAAPIALDGGKGVALALQETTAIKEAQAERERLQARLTQSDRLASMGMLAAGVAHEINNPLFYVLYNISSAAEDMTKLLPCLGRCHEAMLRTLGPEQVKDVLGAAGETFDLAALEDIVKRLREAECGAQRIREIAQGLGTFSRVERQELVPVLLQPVIEQALSMAYNQIKYRARVVKDFSTIPPVLASDGKLAQVFLNLFINAAQAINEGHVEENEIRVRTWSEGDSVFAEVSDTGKGILPEHRQRIFEPFFTTKDAGMGTGLGLAISRNIIVDFGGEISCESQPGRGTCFRVRLPRLPSGWSSERTPLPVGTPSVSAPRGRILVVDDEEGVRSAIVRMLGRDHDVVTAASGEEARGILEKDRDFDLIYCDLMMPRLSGMELHAWLVERDAALAGQVVFITGGVFTPGAANYLARVGNMRVEKPFDTATFKRMTAELLIAARSKRKG